MKSQKVIYDKVTLVVRKSDNMAYLVNPNDENMLANARNWAKYWDSKEEPSEYTVDNGNFELTIIDSADRSSQGGKLSFWTCKIYEKKSGLEVLIGISSDALCKLIKHNTFINGKCNKGVYLVKSSASATALTDSMPEFKNVKIVKTENLRVKRLQTSEWRIGKVYETNTGKNPLLVVGYAIDCAIHRYKYPRQYDELSLTVISATGDYYGIKDAEKITYSEYNYYKNKESVAYDFVDSLKFIVVDLEKNEISIDDIKNCTLLDVVKKVKEFDIIDAKKRVAIETNIDDLFNNEVTLILHNDLLKKQRERHDEIAKKNEYTLNTFKELMLRVSISDAKNFGLTNIKEVVLNKEKEAWVREFREAYKIKGETISLEFYDYNTLDEYIEDYIKREKKLEKERSN